MPGLSEHDPAFQEHVGNRVAPREIDKYDIVTVHHPTDDAQWFGTAAAGTAGQAKAYVVINKYADWPRSLAAGVEGTADFGGSWVLNGKDQFGVAITETIAIGTTANGGTTSGTKVFAQVTSGTFTATSDSVGNGTPVVGADVVAAVAMFGLPVKIRALTDVKSIAWINDGTATTVGGGSVVAAHVDTGMHAFRGTETVAITDTLVCWVKSSYDSSYEAENAALA